MLDVGASMHIFHVHSDFDLLMQAMVMFTDFHSNRSECLGRRKGTYQKTREGCGCFWGLFGSSRGKLRESPGKIAGKKFPNREML